MTDGPYNADEIHLESSLGYYLSKARNVLVERMDRAVKPLGLTAQQIGVILMLSCNRAHTPYELSRAMSYDSGSMTRMLDRLENKGLIRRHRSAHDRRLMHLELTEEGRAGYPRMREISLTVANRFLRGFTKRDARQLEGLLARMLENAQELPARATA